MGPKALGDESIAIGGDVTAQGDASIAIGSDDLYLGKVRGSQQPHHQAIQKAIQNHQELTRIQQGGSGVTQIRRTLARGHARYCSGTMAQAQGHFSNAFGTRATATGNFSLAVGLLPTPNKDMQSLLVLMHKLKVITH